MEMEAVLEGSEKNEHDPPVCLAQSNDGNLASVKILLMNQAFIRRDQQLVSSELGRLQQVAILESRPAQFVCGSNTMTGERPA
jgi:hypothetical protein